jgi:putative SOS response-associated peptidase YedK
MMRWGMPSPPKVGGPPVTNIRNTSSPHWRAWLKPENRCPANSFTEYAPEPNPETKKKDVVWFALNDDRPLFAERDRSVRHAQEEKFLEFCAANCAAAGRRLDTM